MRIDIYTPDMYEELSRWWGAHSGWCAIPQHILPRLGWIIYNGDIPLCAGFLYRDPTAQLAQMEWIVSNPDNSAIDSFKSLDILVKHIVEYADENYLMLFSSVENKGLMRIYERNGFAVSESGMSNMMRVK